MSYIDDKNTKLNNHINGLNTEIKNEKAYNIVLQN